MAATAAGLKALFPAFASEANATIEAWFAEAALRWTLSRLGQQATMVQYLYACHQLTVFPSSGSGAAAAAAGPVTSEKVADLARSYGSGLDMSRVSVSLQPFLTTQYGVQLVGILMSRSRYRRRVIRAGPSAALSSDTSTS